MNIFGKTQGAIVALRGENGGTGVRERHDGARLREEIPCTGHDRRSGFEQLAMLAFERLQLRVAHG